MSKVEKIFSELEELQKKQFLHSKTANHLIQLLINIRNDARKDKNFALSDLVRNRLVKFNIAIEDRANVTEWKHNFLSLIEKESIFCVSGQHFWGNEEDRKRCCNPKYKRV